MASLASSRMLRLPPLEKLLKCLAIDLGVGCHTPHFSGESNASVYSYLEGSTLQISPFGRFAQ
jgi:hypothetical protein